MTNHPSRAVMYIITCSDGQAYGPLTWRAAQTTLSELQAPAHPAKERFAGAVISKIGRLTHQQAQHFGGRLNSARIRS